MEKNLMNLWTYIQSTWKTRAIFVFVILCFWFSAMSTIFCPEIHDLYSSVAGNEIFIKVFSETAMYWYIFGIALGLFGYITGLVWILKKCSKNYSFGTHWIDLTIQRILYGIGFLIVGTIVSKALLSVNPIFPVAAFVFIFIFVLSLIIAFIISGLFVKQSLITEANIKAKEMYNGKKRSVHYNDK